MVVGEDDEWPSGENTETTPVAAEWVNGRKRMALDVSILPRTFTTIFTGKKKLSGGNFFTPNYFFPAGVEKHGR